jgi:hypothetical protein
MEAFPQESTRRTVGVCRTRPPSDPTTHKGKRSSRHIQGGPTASKRISGAIGETVPGWNLGLDD